MLILLLHPHHRHLPRIIHPRHSILSSLSSGNDHHPQALRAFPASVLVPRRIRIHRKSSQVILRLPVLLRCRHPSKEKHSNQPSYTEQVNLIKHLATCFLLVNLLCYLVTQVRPYSWSNFKHSCLVMKMISQ